MSKTISFLKRNLEEYAKKNKKEKLLSIVDNDRMLMSLYELAKLPTYPYHWLDKNQKEFLDIGGEIFLAEFLHKKMPVFSKDDYSSISVSKMAQIVNGIMSDLGFSHRINPSHIDRVLRLKIKPESYRKFTYIVVLLSILWGIERGYFNKILTEKDRRYLKSFALSVLERIINHIKERRLSLSVTEEEFEAAADIIRELDLDKESPNMLYKFYDIKPLIKKSQESSQKEKTKDIERFINLLHVIFSGNISRSVEKIFKCKLSYLYNVLRKESITPQVYDRFITIGDSLILSNNPEYKKLGELLKKIISEKRIKNRGFTKTYNLSKLEIENSEDIGKKYLEFMVKSKDIEKRDFSKKELENLGKFIYIILDYIKDKKGLENLYKVILFEE